MKNIFLLFIALFILSASNVFAGKFFSTTSGNWNSASTWSNDSCGGTPASTIPGLNDTVTICLGNTVTINAAASCADLNIYGTLSNTTFTLAISGNLNKTGSYTSGSGVVTMSGNNKSISGTLTITNLAITGTVSNYGTLTASTTLSGTGTLNNENNARINIGGTVTISNLNASILQNTIAYTSTTANQTIRAIEYNNLTISKTGRIATLAGNITITGNLAVTAGTLADGGFLITGTSAGTFSLAASTVFTSTRTSTPYLPENFIISFNNTSTCNLNANVSFTFPINYTTFGNLTLAGGGTKVLVDNIVLNGNLAISAGMLNTDTSNIVIKGTVTGAGTLTAGNNSTITIGGSTTISNFDLITNSNTTVIYNGTAAQTIKGTSYYNLTIAKSTGVAGTLGAATNVLNNLTISSGTLADGGYQITGNNNGTLNVASGAALTIGATASSNITEFPTLFTRDRITMGATSTVAFQANANQTISNIPIYGNLTILTGTLPSTKMFSATPVKLQGSLNITTASVTLETNSDSIYISGSLTGAGTLNSASSVILIKGSNSHTGTFNCGTGTIIYNGTTAAQTVRGTTYYNLSIDKGATTATIGAATTATNLAVNSGTLTVGAFAFNILGTSNIYGTLTVSSATGAKSFSAIKIYNTGKWNVTAAVPFTISDNIYVESGAVFTSNSGIYTLTGTDKSIYGNSGGITIQKLTVNGIYTDSLSSLTISTTLAGTGTLRLGANSNLFLKGTTTITNLDAATNTPNTVTYNSTTAAQTAKGTTYYNLFIDKLGQTATLNALTTINGNLTINSGRLNDNGYQITGNNTGTLTLKKGTMIYIGKTVGTQFPLNFTASNIILDTNTTVIYNANTTQSISPLPNYWHLTNTTAATANVIRNLAGPINIRGNINLGTRITMNDNGNQITGNATGKLTVAANSILNIGLTTSANATAFPLNFIKENIILSATSQIRYSSNSDQIISNVPNYGHLYLYTGNAAATKTLSGTNVEIIGNLAITNGTGTVTLNIDTNTVNLGGGLSGTGKLSFTSGRMNIGGNNTHTGSFVCGTGTMNYNGTTATQTVRGTTYYNLIVNKPGKTASIAANTTVLNSLKLLGGNFIIGAYSLSCSVESYINGTLTISSAIGAKSFNDLTVDTAGNWIASVPVPFTISGNVIYNGQSFESNTGTYTFTGTNKSFSGSKTLMINNVAVNGTYTNEGTLEILNSLTGTGYFTNNNSLKLSGTINMTGSIESRLGTLYVNSKYFTSFPLIASFPGNTVNYINADTVQSIKGTTYFNLTIDKPSQIAIAESGIIIDGALNIENGTFADNGNQITGNSDDYVIMGENTSFAIGSETTATNFPSNFTKENINFSPSSRVIYCSGMPQFISPEPNYQILQVSNIVEKALSGKTYVNNNLIIDTNAIFNDNSDTLILNGNLTNYGEFIQNGLLWLNGSESQNINSDFTLGITNLKIENSYPLSAVNLNCKVNINGSLNFVNGHIITDSLNSITLYESAVVSGVNNNSFVKGPVFLMSATTNPVTTNVPVGGFGIAHPIGYSFQQATADTSFFMVSYISNSAADLSINLPADLTKVSELGYWHVQKINGNNHTTAYVTIDYEQWDMVTDPDFLRIAKSDNGTWLNLGGTGSGAPNGTIQSSVNFTDHGYFALANGLGGTNELRDTNIVAPSIISNSNDTSICNGDSVTLTVIADGSHPLQYQWFRNNNLLSGSISNQLLINNSDNNDAGEYYCQVTNSYGIANSNPISLTVKHRPNILNYADSLICGPGNISISAASDSGSVNWFESMESVASIYTGEIYSFNNLDSTTVLYAEASHNGCTSANRVSVTARVVTLSADVVFNSPVDCINLCDGNISVNAIGGDAPYVYSYDNGINWTNSGDTTNLCAGTFTLKVKDINNCYYNHNSDITLETPTGITYTSAIISMPKCFDSSDGIATVTATNATAPVTYEWSNGTCSDFNTISLTSTCSSLINGSNYVTITDFNNCSAVASFEMTAPELLAADICSSSPSCRTISNSIADTIFIPDGQQFPLISEIVVSGFRANQTVVDVSDILDITANIEHSYAGDLGIKIICPDLKSVVLKDYATGMGSTHLGEPIDMGPNGDGPYPGKGYNYSWVPANSQYGTMYQNDNLHYHSYVDLEGQNYINVAYLPEGTYLPENSLSNLIGCPINGTWKLEITDQFFIDNGYLFSWEINFSNSITPDGLNTGSATACATGGVEPYSYLWNSVSSTTQNINSIGAGNYIVTVTDFNGCTAIDSVSITNVNLDVELQKQNPSCQGINNGSVTAIASGGTNISYSWNNSENSSVISNLTPGNYILTITDISGCSVTDSVILNNSYIFSAEMNPSNVTLDCFGQSATSNAITSGGVAPYSYVFESVSYTSGSFSNLSGSISGTTHTITVSDNNGCSDTALVKILSPAQLEITSVNFTNPLCHGDNTGSISITAIGGTGAITDSISGIAGTANPAIYNNLGAGLFDIYAFDSKGCNASWGNTVTISNPMQISLTLDSVINTTTLSSCDGQLLYEAANGTSPYLYDIGVSSNSNGIFNNLCTGSYTLTVTDVNNCTFIFSSDTIYAPETIPVIIDSVVYSNPICYNYANGTISIYAHGGNSVLTYNILNSIAGNNTGIFNNLPSGTFEVIVGDNFGQTATWTNLITLTNPSEITLSSENITHATSPVSCDGQLTYSAANGIAPYTYNIGNGNSNNTGIFNGLCAGNYTLTVSDANNCTKTFNTDTITSPQYLPLTIDSVNINNLICFSDSSGTISIFASEGFGALSYSINGITNSTGQFINLTAGSYICTVTDELNNTVQSGPILITEPAQLAFSTTHQDPLCYNGNDGKIFISNLSGGTPPLAFYINGSPTTGNDTISNLNAGTFIMYITDINGCNHTSIDTLQNPIQLTTNILITQSPSCTGADGSATLIANGGTAPYTYLWQQGVSSIDSAAFNLAQGSYTFTVTDANGCQDSSFVFMINPLSPNVQANAISNNICHGDTTASAYASAFGSTPPYSFTWSTNPASNNDTITNLSNGTYFVSVYDANNCLGIDSVVITSPSLVIANVLTQNITCPDITNGNITITASGGTEPYTYTIDGGQNFVSYSAFSSLDSGAYIILVKDVNNCVSESDTFSITKPEQITANYTVQNSICNGTSSGSISFNISGGTGPNYTLSTDGTTFTNNLTISNLTAGSYNVTISDNVGCTKSINGIIVNEPAPIVIDSIQLISSHCNQQNGSAMVFASGGTGTLNFSWDINGQTIDSSFTGNISAGIYYLTVSDNNSCSIVDTVSLSDINAATADFTIMDNLCYGDSAGFAAAFMVGGTAPFTYSWDGVQGNESVNNLTAGIHNFSAIDAVGCITNMQFTIAEPNELILTTDSVTHNLCFGECSGKIELTASGGISPYSFSINTGTFTTDSVFSNLCSGNHLVILRDANNCITSALSININSPSNISLQLISNNPSCNQANGSIALNTSGGTSPYNYLWSNGNSTSSIVNVLPGSYTVTVTDSNNCSVDTTASLFDSGNITANISFTNALCNNTPTGHAEVNAAGGVPPYSFNWSNGNSDSISTSLSAGTYYFTITDDGNCVYTDSVVISEPLPLTISVSNDTNVCAGQSLTLISAASGGSGSFNFQWSNTTIENDTININPIESDTIYLSVTDINGCASFDSVIVSVLPVPSIFLPADTSTCFGTPITINVISDATDFIWNTGDTTSSIVVSLSGNYSVQAIYDNGCTSAESIFVYVKSLGTINGKVYSDDNLFIPNVTVQLIENESPSNADSTSELSIISEIQTEANGNYLFTNVPEGSYYLKAKTHTAGIANLFPIGYSDSTYKWSKAKIFNVNCDELHTKNIKIQQKENTNGSGHISGKITYLGSGAKAEGEPVPGAEVFVELEPDDEPITYSTSTNNGEYSITNIPSGRYSLYVDISGIPLITSYTNFVISNDSSSYFNLNFIVDTSLTSPSINANNSIGIPINDFSQVAISVYPNPFNELLTIQLNSLPVNDILVELYNVTGSKIAVVKNTNADSKTNTLYLNAKEHDLTAGNYYLKLRYRNSILIKKIVLQ